MPPIDIAFEISSLREDSPRGYSGKQLQVCLNAEVVAAAAIVTPSPGRRDAASLASWAWPMPYCVCRAADRATGSHRICDKPSPCALGQSSTGRGSDPSLDLDDTEAALLAAAAISAVDGCTRRSGRNRSRTPSVSSPRMWSICRWVSTTSVTDARSMPAASGRWASRPACGRSKSGSVPSPASMSMVRPPLCATTTTTSHATLSAGSSARP